MTWYPADNYSFTTFCIQNSPEDFMQMRIKVSQGRDFLNSLQHFEPFVDGASKLRVEITMKKRQLVV